MISDKTIDGRSVVSVYVLANGTVTATAEDFRWETASLASLPDAWRCESVGLLRLESRIEKCFTPSTLNGYNVYMSWAYDVTQDDLPAVEKSHYYNSLGTVDPQGVLAWDYNLFNVERDKRVAEKLRTFKRCSRQWPMCCGEPCVTVVTNGQLIIACKELTTGGQRELF